MKLYDFELSGNCYRVRLLLALLGLKHEVVTVNGQRLAAGDAAKLTGEPAIQLTDGDHAEVLVFDLPRGRQA